MDLQTILIWCLIGAVAGWLAGLIVRGFGFGLIGNIVIGIIGAFVGGWLFGQLNIHLVGGIVDTIIAAIVGAVIILFIVRLVKRA